MERKKYDQLEELMSLGELVRISLDRSPLAFAIYEGVINGLDAFAMQQLDRGYPTREIISWRSERKDLIFDPKDKTVLLLKYQFDIYRQNDSNYPKVFSELMRRDIWENPIR